MPSPRPRPPGTTQAGPAPKLLPNDKLDPLFMATVQATEEAIVNAMVAADTMTGAAGATVYALPHDRLQQILRKYNRLELVAASAGQR